MRTVRCSLSFLILAAVSAGAASVRNDFDGDMKSDIAVYHRDAGTWYLRNSGDASSTVQNWGWAAAIPVHGDFDNDGIADFAVYHRATGDWYIRESDTGTIRIQNFGWAGGYPVPGDYDGDGATDLAVFHRTAGTWYIRNSSDASIRIQNWGWAGSRPVPADYDGDNKTDIAVYDPQTGTWYILQSQTGTLRTQSFGWNAVVPVKGDFDGDGKDDIAVYYKAAGTWYILNSLDASITILNWGWFATGPATGDYDGDGKTDIAVYDPAGGNWYIRRSMDAGFTLQNWGWVEARALPAYDCGAAEDIRVHCQGDSITFGRGSSCECPDTGYPVLLDAKIEPTHGGCWTFFNFGISGETTSEGLARLASDLDSTHPDILLLMEGTNDTFFNVPYSTIEANLRSMISTAQSRGIQVVLATIPPVIKNSYRDRSNQQTRIKGFNPTIYTIGADLNVPVATVFEDITAQPNWESDLIDQPTANHPNDAGYLFVRDAFWEAITQGLLDTGLVY